LTIVPCTGISMWCVDTTAWTVECLICICRYEYVVPSYAALFNVFMDICSFSGFYYNFYKIPHSLSCDKYTPLDDDATIDSTAASSSAIQQHHCLVPESTRCPKCQHQFDSTH